ncbi:serine hydrolase-domain-containing protein [Mycena galericulata]|nr:serine hydrolase-domain-containing protein [Mycena galericulata]
MKISFAFLQLSAIQDACKESIEFVFVDAPHILAPVDLSGAPVSDFITIDINGCPARAWWRFLYDMHDVSTVVESFEHIKTVLETQGPFQGIFGFSQGGAFAAMILAFMENPNVTPNLMSDVKHPPFEFAVMVSGFIAPSEDFPLPPRIYTPSLHILGHNDIMVAPEISVQLVERFETAQIEIHQGGHFIPRTRTWRTFLCDYLRSRTSAAGATLDHVPAPTLPVYRARLFGHHNARM